MVAIPGSFEHVVEEFTTPFGVRWRCEKNLDLRGGLSDSLWVGP